MNEGDEPRAETKPSVGTLSTSFTQLMYASVLYAYPLWRWGRTKTFSPVSMKQLRAADPALPD